MGRLTPLLHILPGFFFFFNIWENGECLRPPHFQLTGNFITFSHNYRERQSEPEDGLSVLSCPHPPGIDLLSLFSCDLVLLQPSLPSFLPFLLLFVLSSSSDEKEGRKESKIEEGDSEREESSTHQPFRQEEGGKCTWIK